MTFSILPMSALPLPLLRPSGIITWERLSGSDLFAFKLFAQNPAGWHLLDLLLLSVDAFLLSVFCYQVLKKDKPEEAGAGRDLIFASAFCGMIFLLHPLSLLTGAWTACF